MSGSSGDFFNNEVDRNDFLISIPVIAFAAVFILWQWSSTPSEVRSEQTGIQSTEEIQAVEIANSEPILLTSPSDIHTESNDLDITPIIITNSPWVKVDTGTTFKSFPALSADSNQEELNSVDSLMNDSAVPSPDILHDTSSAPQAVEIEPEALPLGTDPLLYSESLTKTEEKLDCSIAIGLYKVDSNLHKMYNRLIEDDYAAITVPLKYSTKVAIKIPCNKESAHRILKEIRASYARDAYIE